jgi:ABC-type Na+ efflux pump permease subunit
LLRVVWILYSALGILWIVLSLQVVTASPGNQEMIAIMSMAQVSLGLLLLSVSAATSLAEERVRSSLDVLLCTPLSTHSILIGKWWGTFRQATHILAWPAILAGILVMESGRWISYLLLLGLIMANSAVITSLGLVMATWVSRLGRAVTLCVSAYVIFSIGWMLLVFLLAKPGRNNDQFLVPMGMGSPLYGTIVATMAVAPGGLQIPGVAYSALGVFIWIVIDSMVALILFLTALATFDHCLGRISEVAGRSIPDPGKIADAIINSHLDEWLAEKSAEISA